MTEPAERIPREKDPAVIARMMDGRACRTDTNDDLWHVLASYRTETKWSDAKIVKNQFDMARYFYLIAERKPKVVVETGLQNGGSCLFFMDVMRMFKIDGMYVGVDLDCRALHPAVFEYEYPHAIIRRDCLAPETVEKVREFVADRRSLIVLDSVHSKVHVDEELRLYAPLCVPGSSLVIEDADHGGRPIFGAYGPAAGEAVDEFFASGRARKLGFVHDRIAERRFGPFTVSPSAWLKRVR